MSLKLYQINTTLNHPDCMAGLKKMMDDEIFSLFILDIGNEEKIKRRRLEFVADTGYTLENIEKTDYIFCPSALLFSKRFVEKIGNLLREEMKFFSCRLVCQDVSLEWYAAKIMKFMKCNIRALPFSILKIYKIGKEQVKDGRKRKILYRIERTNL